MKSKKDNFSVYFIAENENPIYDSLRVKIGYSNNIERREKELKTGSPYEIKLMGWIEVSNKENAIKLEDKLHEKYKTKRKNGEWFELSASDVLEELLDHSTDAYISVEKNTCEFVSCDNDGIPEYIGSWQWDDLDPEKFCPICGWGGGVHFNDALGYENCLMCGFMPDFHFPDSQDVDGKFE
jgi:predicted GIY-YIG superfamily endonuclease